MVAVEVDPLHPLQLGLKLEKVWEACSFGRKPSRAGTPRDVGQARSEGSRGMRLLLVSGQHAGNCFQVLGLEFGSDAVIRLAVNYRMDVLKVSEIQSDSL